MDTKYISRSIPVTAEKLSVLEEYRAVLQDRLGFKVSLSDAIVHAVKAAKENAAEVERLSLDVKILTDELEFERKPKRDER